MQEARALINRINKQPNIESTLVSGRGLVEVKGTTGDISWIVRRFGGDLIFFITEPDCYPAQSKCLGAGNLINDIQITQNSEVSQ